LWKNFGYLADLACFSRLCLYSRALSADNETNLMSQALAVASLNPDRTADYPSVPAPGAAFAKGAAAGSPTLLLVTSDTADIADDADTAEPETKPSPETPEMIYRFPYCRSGVEIVPDIKGSFITRLLWYKGISVFSVVESTPLRPLARVTLNSQRFDVFLNQHARKKRERILLAGRRKVAMRSARAALRYVVSVEGREDRYQWRWRIGATAPALNVFPSPEAEAEPVNEVSLFLPFAPGKGRVFSIAGSSPGLVLWVKDVALTVIPGDCSGVENRPELTFDDKGFQLTLRQADFSGEGVTVQWESWLMPARTEADAKAALLRHLADAADRAQQTECAESSPGAVDSAPLLKRRGDRAEAALLSDEAVEKKGADRLLFRDPSGRGGDTRHLAGETVDAALAACGLMGRFLQTGDDALRRRARLLANGVCFFQVNEEESSHWGAIWDSVRGKGKNTIYEDLSGERTLSVATTARTSKGLHLLHSHFGTERYQRTALTAAHWLLLKMDRDGFIAGERVTEDGPPVEGQNSPWIVGEALIPLMETFRANENEVFMKTALRVVRSLKAGIEQSELPFDRASTEQMASTIEGILLVSREYEKDEMITLARQIGVGLRARRLPDGSLMDPPGVAALSPLAPTLAGARAALALARVDDDPLWPLFAYRAFRAAAAKAAHLEASGTPIQIADQSAFLTLSTALLLAIAARAGSCVADVDRLTITRSWQTFAPDPATREYIHVFAVGPGGEEIAVDYLALVCPVSLQVLISVFAPAWVTEVTIRKNGKIPFVKNLLTGDFDMTAPLLPFTAAVAEPEANIGVFLADT
jgi:hypothetical protein